MNKTNTEKICKFIEKVPAAIWCLLVAGSCILADVYTLVADMPALIDSINEYMSQIAVEFTGFISESQMWVFYLEEGLVGLLFFEIILSIVYRYMLSRGYASTNYIRFKNVARVCYALANCIVGLFSLINFAVPDLQYYGYQLFDFVIYTLAYTAAYSLLKSSVINPKLIATAYRKLFTFYFALEGILAIFNFIMYVSSKDTALHLVIASGCRLAVIALMGALLYFFVLRPLTKAEKNYIEIIPPKNDDSPPPPDEIFKGYGF